MSYSIIWADKKAKKSYDGLSPLIKDRIKETIQKLSKTPYPKSAKKLKGKLKGVLRIRVGDYRILYDVNDKRKEVILLHLGHRRQIYR